MTSHPHACITLAKCAPIITFLKFPMCNGAFGLLDVCSMITFFPCPAFVHPYFVPCSMMALIASLKTFCLFTKMFMYGPTPWTDLMNPSWCAPSSICF